MSITAEMAKDHAKDPAVLCCRAEAGTVLEAANLEDPAIFADLEDSGLLTIPDNVLKIEQVIGATLKQTADSLVPLTADMVDGIKAAVEAPAESEPVKDVIEEEAPVIIMDMTRALGFRDDYDRFYSLFVKEVRDGKLGNYTLDTLEDLDGDD